MDQVNEKIKIGIVGAGLSGCSVAYFLKEIFGDKVDLVVFESSDTIGGRLATFEFNDRAYEIGGSILHSSNLYMKSFVKLLELEKKEEISDSSEYLGLYDSEKIVFDQNGDYFGIIDKFKAFRHFSFWQLIRLNRWIESLVQDFSKIYKLQDNGFTFKNLEQFLTKLNPHLYEISQMSTRKALEINKFNEKIINEIASVACLSNYGQSIDVNGFVGVISLAGTVGDLWAVKNGNKQIPIKLLEKSQAQLYKNTVVKLISKDEANPDKKNLIVYQTENQDEIIDNSFDYVVISCPIHDKINDNFIVDFDSFNEMKKLKMQLTNTYTIFGKVNLFPNIPVNKRAQLHSIDKDVPYRCVSVQLPCDYDKKKDVNLFMNDENKLYKIFSDKYLESDTFNKIFQNGYKLVKNIPWLAYPKYDENPKTNSMPSIVMDSDERSRIFYSNAIEWSSSCMEICCIQARNISLLISNQEKKLANPKRKRFFSNPLLADRRWSDFLHRFAGFLTLGSILAFLIAIFLR